MRLLSPRVNLFLKTNLMTSTESRIPINGADGNKISEPKNFNRLLCSVWKKWTKFFNRTAASPEKTPTNRLAITRKVLCPSLDFKYLMRVLILCLKVILRYFVKLRKLTFLNKTMLTLNIFI